MKITDLPKTASIALLRKWRVALLSGKYDQGQYTLRATRDTGPVYCCLGVLAKVAGVPPHLLAGKGFISYKGPVTESGGALEIYKLLDTKVQDQFSKYNDNKHMTFKQIAGEVGNLIARRVRKAKLAKR